MSLVTQSARGASAFTLADPPWSASGIGDAPFYSKIDDDYAHTWPQLIDELHRIRQLEDNWDGEGTEAPPPGLVDGAIRLAQYLKTRGYPPADRVLASVNGTVYFEWHNPLGYGELEVMSPLEAEWRWVPKGSDATTVVRLTRSP
ncbi:MAG: hypothetical protein N2039_09935 [Gemmataceae bacterium]|nr:hypothetical protein [Gemmataceae bacterium]